MLRKSKPDFIIVGAAKAGTTSLAYYLMQHPKIKLASKKEPQYFTKNYHLGNYWYRSLFGFKWDRRLFFEASTSYMLYPEVAQRIYDTFGLIKIVILLREPVSRAISNYVYYKNNKKIDTGNFLTSIREDLEKYKMEGLPKLYNDRERYMAFYRRGVYIDQIMPYYDLFGSENVLIVFFEDLKEDPLNTTNSVIKFLGLTQLDSINAKVQNSTYYDKIKIDTTDIRDIYIYQNKQLFDFLGIKNKWV